MSQLLDMPMPVLGALAILGMIAGGVYLFGLTKKWGALLPYMGMLLFASMAIPIGWNDKIKPTVWLPIQTNRSNLFLVCGIATMGIVLAQIQNLKGKPQSLMSWVFLLSAFYAAMMRFVHEGPSSGVLSVFFALITILPLMLLPAIVMRELDDFVLILRAIAVSNAVWVGMVMVQLVVNPKYLTMGNSYRFVGLLANPQHAGTLMPFICCILLWLVLNDSNRYKLFFLALLCINGVFQIWTGSRTGLGMVIIGVCAVLYGRVGRAILVLPLIGLFAYLGLNFVTNVLNIDFGADRLTSTLNTRDRAWANLLQIGLDNPILGVGVDESENSENSWLYAFASYGIGMLGIVILLTFVGFATGLRWIRARFLLPAEYRPMMDMCISVIAMYFAGAVLEGYVLSRVAPPLCFFPVFAGAGVILSKYAYSYNSSVEFDEYEDHYEEWATYGDEYTA
ncbi:MAG: O-antigen ligase family protein [Phycisphaerales bacterium]